MTLGNSNGINNNQIILPELAHNTIGEIPLIEHFDDGDLGGKGGYYKYTIKARNKL